MDVESRAALEATGSPRSEGRSPQPALHVLSGSPIIADSVPFPTPSKSSNSHIPTSLSRPSDTASRRLRPLALVCLLFVSQFLPASATSCDTYQLTTRANYVSINCASMGLRISIPIPMRPVLFHHVRPV